MLVRFFRTLRHLFQLLPLSFFQHLILLLALLLAHRFRENLIVEIHQILLSSTRRIAHPLQILRIRIHLYPKHICHAHLILQNRPAPLSTTDEVPAAVHRSFQHHQSDLVLLPKDHLFYLLRLVLLSIAVHIVEEETSDALTSRQQPVHMADVIRQLQQLPLRLGIPLPGFRQQAKVGFRIPQRQQFLAVLHEEGKFLAPALPIVFKCYLIYHMLFTLNQIIASLHPFPSLAPRFPADGSSATSHSSRRASCSAAAHNNT